MYATIRAALMSIFQADSPPPHHQKHGNKGVVLRTLDSSIPEYAGHKIAGVSVSQFYRRTYPYRLTIQARPRHTNDSQGAVDNIGLGFQHAQYSSPSHTDRAFQSSKRCIHKYSTHFQSEIANYDLSSMQMHPLLLLLLSVLASVVLTAASPATGSPTNVAVCNPLCGLLGCKCPSKCKTLLISYS